MHVDDSVRVCVARLERCGRVRSGALRTAVMNDESTEISQSGALDQASAPGTAVSLKSKGQTA